APMQRSMSSAMPNNIADLDDDASAWRDAAVITAERLPAITPEMLEAFTQNNISNAATTAMARRTRMAPQRSDKGGRGSSDGQGRDTARYGSTSMFFFTIEDGQRALIVERSGRMFVVEGPKRVWRWGRKLRPMQHYVAHPGDFLIVRYRDGRQEHLEGPAHVWLDPREHMSIAREETLPISAKEAVVVYSEEEEGGSISRRIAYGPALFVPRPGEWLHTFSWHGTAAGGDGYRKVPNALVFQKLWLMPDQMYHDVSDVRTADDAQITIRLMIFFELRDIEKMLETTHDPLGDFINAATADVIEFVSQHDFEAFKQHTGRLNHLETYGQLVGRAEQCGYHINKVVYRGYGAPAQLQRMHDEAIASRTRLQLERATEQQAQELEDFKLDRKLGRDARLREEQQASIAHELDMKRQRLAAHLESERQRRSFERAQVQADTEAQRNQTIAQHEAERQHLAELSSMNVDLTALLTQHRADRVIELRGGANGLGSTPHVHLPATELFNNTD
ncbi:MAG: hypothetical protein AAFS10_23990, partial [Myxococcota bacterium]